MDKKEKNALDLIGEMLLNITLPEDAPANIKLSREMIRFNRKTSKAAMTASNNHNDGLCALIYAIMRDTNDKILALCNGEDIQAAPVKEEAKPVFKVGQRVQFKTWEEFVEEFGLDNHGNIGGEANFIKEMRHLCGTKGTIKKIKNKYVELSACHEDAVNWIISVDMLKPVQEV